MPVIENLSLLNFSGNNILEELELSADAAPGQPTIATINPSGATDNDYLVLAPGEETSEMAQINTSGVSGNNITFRSNLLLQHRNHERVIKLFGNQIKVYKAANISGTVPPDASFSPVGSPITIEVDAPFTLFVDSNGGSAYWYKFTYYNATSTAETDISLGEAIRGGGYGDYVSIADIRAEAGLDETRRLDNTQVAARRAAAQSEIKGRLASAGYTMPLQDTNGNGFVPDVIRDITRILAAGLVLKQNFGVTKPGSKNDGQSKIDEARQILAEIQLDDLLLLDSNEQLLAKAALVSGWPDDTTMDDGVNIGSTITMAKKF